MCDRCQKGFHARCLGVESIGDLPDVWYCRECHAAQKLEATSAAHLNPQPLFAQYRTRNGPFEVQEAQVLAYSRIHTWIYRYAHTHTHTHTHTHILYAGT